MPVEPALVMLRWLQFAAAAVALGLPLFEAYVVRAGSSSSARRTGIAAGGLLACAAAAGLVAQTALMAGGWTAALSLPALEYVLQSTGPGLAHGARATLALAGVALLLIGRDDPRAPRLAVVAFAGATAGFAWSGHGASSEGAVGVIHLLADIVHAVAAAVWLGALVGFCLRLARQEPDTVATARALTQFAGVGTAAVLALALSGLVNAAFLIGPDGASRLPGSIWGGLLFAKLALLAVMLGLAAHNRYSLAPALAAAVAAGRDPAREVRGLRVSIGLELGAGLVLLGLVAVMGIQTPPVAL
jgi:putative copper resistance protein D